MNREKLKHIFDNTACLTAKQMRSYAAGKMVHEEARAVEAHLQSCPFCSDALEGVEEQKNNGSLETIERIDSTFLQKHFGLTNPEIHLNSMASQAQAESIGDKVEKIAGRPTLWRNIAIAASVLIVVGVFWFMRDSIFNISGGNEKIAQNTEVEQTPPPPPVEEEAVATTTEDTASMATGMVADAQGVGAEDVSTRADMPTPTETVEPAVAKKEDKVNALMATAAEDASKKIKKDEPIATTVAAAKTADMKMPAEDDKYKSRVGNSYTPENAAEKKTEEVAAAAPAAAKEAPKKTAETVNSGISDADKLYNSGEYRQALKLYQEEMFNTKSSNRDQATMMAAKCHLKVGEKVQARTLLNSLIRDRSPLKDKADKILQDME
ncbi:MAG: hypothetical protein KDC11_00905 [Chitinophagaceae bacterium]|nr:hypothetical protein [Chitinophagaceae bacterium]